MTHGDEVVGVELVELAAQAFFAERGLAPKRREQGDFVVYEHGNLAIWVGDFFATTGAQLGSVRRGVRSRGDDCVTR